jgi:hypothetical protein
MRSGCRTRTAFVLLLALLAGLPGGLYAACGPLCASPGARSCCYPRGGTPAVHAPSCCDALKTLAPVESARAVESAASAPAAGLAAGWAAPLALPAEQPLPALLPLPPLLHERVGLHTLHAVFLI